jgi:NADH dehydrogenase
MAQIVTVFGGTGFLGREVAGRLRQAGVSLRIASRHPDRSRKLFGGDTDSLRSIGADIHDGGSVRQALTGVDAAVNAVSLYAERGSETFQSVHVDAARRVARLARESGVRCLAHVSGIGSDPGSSSKYIKARGEGELAVRDAFPEVTLIRPAVMFGANDAFLKPIIGLLARLPVYPMFGQGETRLQPAFVEDVAQAIVVVTEHPDAGGRTFECAGPRVYTYAALLRTIADAMHVRRQLVPMPFAAWHVLAGIAEWLPRPPITRNQVELMETDNVARPHSAGFAELGIAPRSLEEILPTILRDHDRGPSASSRPS